MAMYPGNAYNGSQIGSGVSGKCAIATEENDRPPKTQIHPGILAVRARIEAVNRELDIVLARARGSQPSESTLQGKETSEPSTMEHLECCHKALSYLEGRIQELVAVLG